MKFAVAKTFDLPRYSSEGKIDTLHARFNFLVFFVLFYSQLGKPVLNAFIATTGACIALPAFGLYFILLRALKPRLHLFFAYFRVQRNHELLFVVISCASVLRKMLKYY